MGKVKWGSDLNKSDIDNVDTTNRGGRYLGPLPPADVYRWNIRKMTTEKSKAGNPMVVIMMTIDGGWKDEHARYDGAPTWDRPTVMQSTAWKIRDLCDALGCTSAEFMDETLTDKEGVVQKIGRLSADKGWPQILAVARHGEDNNGGKRLEIANYVPREQAEEVGAFASSNGKPAKKAAAGKKDKKGKKGKAATTVTDDEPPF